MFALTAVTQMKTAYQKKKKHLLCVFVPFKGLSFTT